LALLGYAMGVLRHLKHYFSHIMAVSFIDGERNWVTQREPWTSHKSLPNFNTNLYRIQLVTGGNRSNHVSLELSFLHI